MQGGATGEFPYSKCTHWVINLHKKKAQTANSAFSNKARTSNVITLLCYSYKLIVWNKAIWHVNWNHLVGEQFYFLLSRLCLTEQCLSQHFSNFWIKMCISLRLDKENARVWWFRAVMDTVKVALFLLSWKKKHQFLKNSLGQKFWFLKTALNLLKSIPVTF